jgi:hypothetical protein
MTSRAPVNEPVVPVDEPLFVEADKNLDDSLRALSSVNLSLTSHTTPRDVSTDE